MKRVILALVSTISGLVMLLSFKTHAVSPSTAAAAIVAQPTPTVSASASAGASSATSTTPTPAATATTTTTTTKTVTGSSVDTRWGPVQVRITVTNGKIVAAKAVVYPESNPRDQEINAYAVPTLEQETVAANSASIQMVSGATYTSDGYISSLQSALDKL